MSGTLRCPKNYVVIRYPFNNDSIKLGQLDNWKIPVTETQENFTKPIERPNKNSRNSLLEKYLWTELTNEYIRNNNDLLEPKDELLNTEYMERFSKLKKYVPITVDPTLRNKYPINGTEPITFWCSDGKRPTPFKRQNTLTKPNSETLDLKFR